jgi:Fe-S-cluster-containing dehydrogenase component/DMSO reductase anchor subunit
MSSQAAVVRLPLIDRLLKEQRETAVERFARRHERGAPDISDAQSRYRELLPMSAPRPGEQYAFEVDLDRCTGCKACVTGCHSLNGLDDGEVWRSVGMLHGGSAAAPMLKTITTSCHHCVEPACMSGCPVKAYEKDPVTGIVKHLDDQCIGCKYCLFMCPYEAPKFNARRGIVRKCDMCSSRLEQGEAPACVQACPTQAIRISVVEQTHAYEAAQAGAFLTGAPSPKDTIPTTSYRSKKELPRNLLPADFYVLGVEPAHPPLTVMLVLTQLSVGAFAVGLIERLAGVAAPGWLVALQAWAALVLCLAALNASALHLGRPHLAFRAILGLRTSWLSREIVAFGLFAAAAGAYATSLHLPVSAATQLGLLWATVLTGVAGVQSSVMVYGATRRPSWRTPRTAARFFGTAALLGTATAFVVGACAGRLQPLLVVALELAALAKVGGEALALGHLRDRQQTVLKHSALIMVGPLRRPTVARFVCGVVGGVLLPLAALARGSASPSLAALALVAFALTVAGELIERHLFFVAAAGPRMPGSPA